MQSPRLAAGVGSRADANGGDFQLPRHGGRHRRRDALDEQPEAARRLERLPPSVICVCIGMASGRSARSQASSYAVSAAHMLQQVLQPHSGAGMVYKRPSVWPGAGGAGSIKLQGCRLLVIRQAGI